MDASKDPNKECGNAGYVEVNVIIQIQCSEICRNPTLRNEKFHTET